MMVGPVQPRRWWGRPLGWMVFVAACGVLGWGKGTFDRYRDSELARWGVARPAETAARRRTCDVIDHSLWWVHADNLEEARKLFPLPAGTLDALSGKGFESVTVPAETIQPGAGSGSVTLGFKDGVFSVATVSVPPLPPGPNESFYVWVDRTSNAVLFLAIFVWLGGVLGGWMERDRQRFRFGETAAGAALVATALWAARPESLSTPRGYVGIGAGIAATCFALAMTRWLWRTARTRMLHVCDACGYDLHGNLSGICPECGATTFDGLLRARANRAAAVAESVAHTVVDDTEPVADVDPDIIQFAADPPVAR